MFICKECSTSFKPAYFLASTQHPIFCSRSCSTTNQRSGYKSAGELSDAIKDFILRRGDYVTKDEIQKELGISSKTLTKFKISILNLNKEMGMKKPRSMFQHLVGIYVDEYFPDVVYEKSFDGLVSPKGYPLRYDFYIPSFNLIIEADGKQHGDREHYYSTESTMMCDALKEDYCTLHGVKLVRMPYSRKVTREYVESILREHEVI